LSELLTSDVFETQLHGTHGAIVPTSIAKMFLDEGQKRIVVSVALKEKEVRYHSALHFYQNQYLISYSKQYQKAIEAFPSDYVSFRLIEDTSEYGVEMPEEFQAVLDSDPDAFEIFEGFTPGKQRSLIYFILKIKASQTRIDKAILISENMKRGIIDPKELIQPNFR